MYCAGSQTYLPQDPPCPPISVQAPAIIFVTLTALLCIGGLALFWFFRHEPLVAKRDWISTIVVVAVTLLTVLSAYFDRTIPCWAYFALNYTINSVIPGIIISRLLGLYARHERQLEAVRAPLRFESAAAEVQSTRQTRSSERSSVCAARESSSVEVLPDPRHRHVNAQSRPSPRRQRDATWPTLFSRIVLYLRLDNPRCGVFLLLSTTVPFGVYYAIRLATSPLHRSSESGCIYDETDSIFGGIVSFLSVSASAPTLWATCTQRRDTLFIGFELACQIIIWPPMVLWLIDFSPPNGAHLPLKGLYGILIGCILTLVSTVWVPSIVAGWRWSRSRNQVFPRGVDQTVGSPASAQSSTPNNHPQQSAMTSTSDGMSATMVDRIRSAADIGRIVVDVTEGRSTHTRLAGMLTAANRFVLPKPTQLELLTTLAMPIPSVLEHARTLCIFGAMLIATPSGHALLEDTLQRSFSAELLGFLIDVDAVARTARAWLAATASVASPVPHVVTSAPFFKSVVGVSQATQLLAKLSDEYARFFERYIEFGAPHYINIGRGVLALSHAARALQARHATTETSRAILDALHAIAHAEVDVFERLVFEPLASRMRSRAGLFVGWAVQARLDVAEAELD